MVEHRSADASKVTLNAFQRCLSLSAAIFCAADAHHVRTYAFDRTPVIFKIKIKSQEICQSGDGGTGELAFPIQKRVQIQCQSLITSLK